MRRPRLLSYVVQAPSSATRQIHMWAGVGYSTREEIVPVERRVLQGSVHAQLETMSWTDGSMLVESAVSDVMRTHDVELVPHYDETDQSLYVMLLLSGMSFIKYLRLRYAMLRELRRAFPHRTVSHRRVIDVRVVQWAAALLCAMTVSLYLSAGSGAASVLSVSGLALDIFGVLLLYNYGLSMSHSKASSLAIGGGGYDHCEERRHAVLSRGGLGIVVLGFALQALSSVHWVVAWIEAALE